MTALLYSSATLNNGIVAFGQVTNTWAGYLQSGGVAYDLQLPFQADKFEWWNYTKYGTNDNNLSGIWFRDFPAGDGLITRRGTTTLTSTLETTNGVTINNTPAAFTDQHLVVQTITPAAVTIVTTTTNHGLSSGDRVFLTKIVGNIGDVLNNHDYVIQVTGATTFTLYDVYGVPIATTGLTYTSGGQVTIEGPLLNVQNSPTIYRLTLGSAVMGADNDVIYFVATQFNTYQNLGDVA